MTLNPKQGRFIDEYLIDLNATQAAIRAGYSKRTARSQGARLLTNVDIRAAVTEGTHAAAERAELSQDYVLSQLQEVAERCMQRVPVLDKKGNGIGGWAFQPSPAIRALELLGKHIGMWPSKLSIEDHRKEAEALADVLGLDVDEIMAEVERMLKGEGGSRPATTHRR